MQTEAVTRVRGSVVMRTLAPVQATSTDEPTGAEFKTYLDETSDVAPTDQLLIRGKVHEVIGVPELRPGFALVVWTAEAASTYDCQVVIAPPGTESHFNPETRVTETEPADPIYTGPASIVPASKGTDTESAGDDVAVTTYEVRVTRDGTDQVSAEHAVTVTDAPDPALVGRRLWVTAVVLDTRSPSRLLYATLTDG